MKKIIFIIILVVMAYNMPSQSVTIYESLYKDYIGSMDVLELDDGSIIELENYCVLEETEEGQCVNITTIGTNIIKINDNAERLDSLFVAFPKLGMMLGKCILTKNPYEDDSYILADFYHNENGYYYTAMFFDGDLNITDTIDIPFEYDNVNVSCISNPFIDHNNDIVFCAVWENEADIIFIKMDLWGNVKEIFFSDLSFYEYNIKKSTMFVYDEEPLSYGVFVPKTEYNSDSGVFLWNGSMAVIIIDENMEISRIIDVYEIDNKVRVNPTIGMYEMIRLKDGNFATCLTVMDTKNNINTTAIQLTKFNKNFEMLQHNRFFENNSVDIPFIPNVGCLTMCDDGSVYVNYIKREMDTGINKLYVAYVDNNLNTQWNVDIYTTCPNALWGSPVTYSSCVRKNGGVIICGWGDFTCNENSMSFFPLVLIVDNNGTVISENPNNNRPYSFYPNPANDVINISFSPDVNVEKVEIYGLDGKLYHEQNFNLETVNINSLSNGVYMMKVVLDNGTTFNDKIVVK